jgi:NADPH:quinone reductase-like Zn-dependent oxidoreductase
MKILSYKNYGGPEVLHVIDKEIPEPTSTQVLVKVNAAALNPVEWHLMKASLFILRLAKGLFKPKNPYLGADIAGVVTKVGSDVTQFKVGDEIYGRNLVGGFAEYACIDEGRAYFKPSNITFEQASAIPLAALTALQGLNSGNISDNKKILINGASGGIGTFAIQLAKQYNTRITGVCSTQNLELVKSLGADFVIDYTKENISDLNEDYDIIVDLIGNLSTFTTNKILKKGGTCVIIGFETFSKMLKGVISHRKKTDPNKKNRKLLNTKIVQKDLQFISQLVEKNILSPVIDKTFSFKDTQKAFSYLGSKRAKGKVVISINYDTEKTKN